jgi:DNA-directed RNA polymerase specialized sigma24 family protein
MGKFRDDQDWDRMSSLPASVDWTDPIQALMASPNEPEPSAVNAQLRLCVTESIAQLGERDRFVLEAIYVWGKSYSELSEMMGFASKASAHGAVKTAEANLRAILVNKPEIREMIGEQ